MQSNQLNGGKLPDLSMTNQRVTVPETAKILGISPEAVRARIQRRTLLKGKAHDGTIYV
jgi:hypothetical protein